MKNNYIKNAVLNFRVYYVVIFIYCDPQKKCYRCVGHKIIIIITAIIFITSRSLRFICSNNANIIFEFALVSCPPPHRTPPHPAPSSCYHDPLPGLWTPTHPGLAASYGPGTDRAGLLVPAEDLGDTTVRNSQLSRDYARSDAVVGHLHYLVSDVIWQGPPVDEHSAKLVHPTLAQRRGYCATIINNKSQQTTQTSHFL